MDRIKETASLIKQLNSFKRQKVKDYEYIKIACEFFDKIKSENLSQADLQFLKYISNTTGIPHFFDLLSNFNNHPDLESISLSTFSSYFYESSLYTTENHKVHKYQEEILAFFKKGVINRYFLSASTSFGKTHLAYEVIKKMEYNNVILIFPTIALLSENLEKIFSNPNYIHLKNNYSVHTLSEIENFANKNLLIFTPERFLSFIEKNEGRINIDFFFVDEVYKIDNDYIIEEEINENERDVAYRLAVFYTLNRKSDVLLAGPYIDFNISETGQYQGSFNNFLLQNEIRLIDYNNYEIVNKTFSNIIGKSKIKVDEDLSFEFINNDKDKMLFEIIKAICSKNENTIVYCSLRSQVESCSKKIIKSSILENHDYTKYLDFLDHITRKFSDEWTLIKALKNGIGIHHGLVPKYIQKEIVTLFNNNLIKALISTTTITEGVNTSAKNLIVYDSKKGDKPLKKFDAKNIAGRAGRFLQHYSGRVIVLKNNFMEVINSQSEGIKHKNYDQLSPKDEIDLYYTLEEFLNDKDRDRKQSINLEQKKRNLPDYLFEYYKVISRLDKITVFDKIQAFSTEEFKKIDTLIYTINVHRNISYEGFQVVLNSIRPIIRNQELQKLIDRMVLNKKKNQYYSLLTFLILSYLRGGFIGSVLYKQKNQNKSVDTSIRETASFVYSTLKYNVVKYLGVFNLLYKYHISIKDNIKFENVKGLDSLLLILEYNALTEKGRIASDYGVPSSIVDYYENETQSQNIKSNFDAYEYQVFRHIESIINKE